MSKIIAPVEMPYTCSECHFRSRIEEFMFEPGLYKKISRCLLAPDDVEDPWRDITWQVNHKETWCPLEDKPSVDRSTALVVLKDLSSNMRPDHDLFGNETLTIHRYMFENIRKKYLDGKDIL